MHLRAVHRVGAVGRDHDAEVARVRLERRAEHAGVGVDAGEDQRPRGQLALEHELEVGPVEAVVALLAIDDLVPRVEKLRDDLRPGATRHVVPRSRAAAHAGVL